MQMSKNVNNDVSKGPPIGNSRSTGQNFLILYKAFINETEKTNVSFYVSLKGI